MLVIYLLHFRDIVEVTDNGGCSKGFTCLDVPAVQLFDHADIASLMTPAFRSGLRVERHARQPRARLFVYLYLVGAYHACRQLSGRTLVEEFAVRSEVLGECGRR